MANSICPNGVLNYNSATGVFFDNLSGGNSDGSRTYQTEHDDDKDQGMEKLDKAKEQEFNLDEEEGDQEEEQEEEQDEEQHGLNEHLLEKFRRHGKHRYAWKPKTSRGQPKRYKKR